MRTLFLLLSLFALPALHAQQAVRLGPMLGSYASDNPTLAGLGGTLEFESDLSRRFSFALDFTYAQLMGNITDGVGLNGQVLALRPAVRYYPGGTALSGFFVAAGVQVAHVQYDYFDIDASPWLDDDLGTLLGPSVGLGAVLVSKGDLDVCARFDAMASVGEFQTLFAGGLSVGYRF